MGHYVLFARRWLVLIIGFIINFALWSVAHPFVVPSTAGRWLCPNQPVSVTETRFISYAWFMSAIIGCLPGLWLMKHLGLRKALTICVSCMVLGVSLRCVLFAAHGMDDDSGTADSACSMSAYWWILGGNCVAALGAVPIQASVVMIAATWFPASQFGLATTLMSLSIPAGLHFNLVILSVAERSKLLLAIGFDRELIVHVAIAALALLAVPLMSSAPPLKPCITAEPPCRAERDRELLGSPDSSRHGITSAQELLTPLSPLGDSGGLHGDRSGGSFVPTSPRSGSGVAAGVSTGVGSGSGSSPRDDVSLQLKREQERRERPLLSEVCAVLMIPHFWKILVAFSAGVGACIVYYLLLEEFLDSSGGANLEDAINLLVVAGSFGAIAVPASVLSCLLDCTRGHKYIIAASQTVVVALAAVLTIGISSQGTYENIQACLICMSVMAFLAIPIALDIASEYTYPMRSVLSASLLWVGAYITAIVLGIVADVVLVNDDSPRPRFSGAKYMLLGCFGVAAILWWLLPVRYVKRVVEEMHKESQQASSAPRERLLGAVSRSESTRSSRSWINGAASGRFSVPSINRNLYIIAEEHGISSASALLYLSALSTKFVQHQTSVAGVQSGGHTGGGTGSIRNSYTAPAAGDADRATTTATESRNDLFQSPTDSSSQFQSHSNSLATPAGITATGSANHSSDAKEATCGKIKQLSPEAPPAGMRLLSQMQIDNSEQLQAGSDTLSIKLAQTASEQSQEHSRERVRPLTGDSKASRQLTSTISQSHSQPIVREASNKTSSHTSSHNLTSSGTGTTSSGRKGSNSAESIGMKGSAESIASSSHFVWRMPPFSYFLKRGSGTLNSGSLSSGRGGGRGSLGAGPRPGSGSVSGGDTIISHGSSQSMLAARANSGSRGLGAAESGGARSDGSLIQWAMGTGRVDSNTGGSSNTSGGAAGSLASSMTLAHQLRKTSGSITSGQHHSQTTQRSTVERLRSGSVSNTDSISDTSLGHHQISRQSSQAESPEHKVSGGILSLREVVRERSAQNAQLQAQLQLPPAQENSNSMVGHVSDSGIISDDLYATASVSLDGTAIPALKGSAAHSGIPAGAAVHAGRAVAPVGSAAAVAQHVPLQQESAFDASAQVGRTEEGGTITQLLGEADIVDADRFADPLSPRGSQAKVTENLSNLSLSTALTTPFVSTELLDEEASAAATHAAESSLPQNPAFSTPAVANSTVHGSGSGSASGTGTGASTAAAAAMHSSQGATINTLGLSTTETQPGQILSLTPPRGTMVWWANPLGDGQRSAGASAQLSSMAALDTGFSSPSVPTASRGNSTPVGAAGINQSQQASLVSEDSSAAKLRPRNMQEELAADAQVMQVNTKAHKLGNHGHVPFSQLPVRQYNRDSKRLKPQGADSSEVQHSSAIRGSTGATSGPRVNPIVGSSMSNDNVEQLLHTFAGKSSAVTGPLSGDEAFSHGQHAQAPLKSTITSAAHSPTHSSASLGGSIGRKGSRKASRDLHEDRSGGGIYGNSGETPFHSPRTPRHIMSPRPSPCASPGVSAGISPPAQSSEPLSAEPVSPHSKQREHISLDPGSQHALHMHEDARNTASNTISLSPSPHDPHNAGGQQTIHSIDGLLRSSLQSSQLFGSVLAPHPHGAATLPDAASSQLDPVSAVAVRMHHHDAVSSVLQPFTLADSATLQPHGGLHASAASYSPALPSIIAHDSQSAMFKSQTSTSSPLTLAARAQQGTTSATQSAMSPPSLTLNAPYVEADASISAELGPEAVGQQQEHTEEDTLTHGLSSGESFVRAMVQMPPSDAALVSYGALEDTLAGSSFSPLPSSGCIGGDGLGVPYAGTDPSAVERSDVATASGGLSSFFGQKASLKWFMSPKTKQKKERSPSPSQFPEAPASGEHNRERGGPSASHHQQGDAQGNSGHSREMSMCLDTYPEVSPWPEGQSSKFARDRSAFSLAPSIDIQICHHAAPTDELSHFSASLMVDSSALENGAHMHGMHAPDRERTREGAATLDSNPLLVAHPAHAAHSCRDRSGGVRSGTLSHITAQHTRLPMQPRPTSAPQQVSAAAAAAARFGVTQHTSALQILKKRTAQRVQHADALQQKRPVSAQHPQRHNPLRHAASYGSAGTLRMAAKDTDEASQLLAGIPLDATVRATGANSISSAYEHTEQATSSGRKSGASSSRKSGTSSGSRKSTESFHRPQSAPEKSPHWLGGIIGGVEESSKGPPGEVLRDANSADATEGASRDSSSAVSGKSSPRQNLVQSQRVQSNTVVGHAAFTPEVFTTAFYTPGDFPHAATVAATAVELNGVARAGAGGLDAETEALKALLADDLEDKTEDENSNNDIKAQGPWSEIQLLALPPTVPDHQQHGDIDSPTHSPIFIGDVLRDTRARSLAPSVAPPVEESGPLASYPQEGQPASGATEAEVVHSRGITSEFSAGASAPFTLSVMSNEQPSTRLQGMWGPGGSAVASGTSGVSLGSVASRLGGGLSGISAVQEDGGGGVAMGVLPATRRGAQIAGDDPERGAGAGQIHVGMHAYERGESSDRQSAIEVMHSAGAAGMEGLTLRERFALHVQRAQREGTNAESEEMIQAMHTDPSRSGFPTSAGAATGRRTPQAAAAVAVAQAQARSRLNMLDMRQAQVPSLPAAQSQAQAAVAAAQARTGAVAAAQQHVLPHQRTSTSQDEKTKRFWEQTPQSNDGASTNARGSRASTAAPLHPGLHLEAMAGSFKDPTSAAAAAVAQVGPQSGTSMYEIAGSRLYSLPGAGDSASVNESPIASPIADAVESGGSVITERSGESVGSRPFGSEFGWPRGPYSGNRQEYSGSRQGPSSTGSRHGPSSGSQGKPHPLSKVQQR